MVIITSRLNRSLQSQEINLRDWLEVLLVSTDLCDPLRFRLKLVSCYFCDPFYYFEQTSLLTFILVVIFLFI